MELFNAKYVLTIPRDNGWSDITYYYQKEDKAKEDLEELRKTYPQAKLFKLEEVC